MSEIKTFIENVRIVTLDQPSEFQETLSYVCENVIDPDIKALMDIVSDMKEGIFFSSTHI
jgi:hypothetical protein